MKTIVLPSLQHKIALLLLVLIVMTVMVFVFSSPYYEGIRCMARYTARISTVLFLIAIYQFIMSTANDTVNLYQSLVLLAVNHFIHFGFLAANVVVNKIDLVPIKLLGGFLAYLLILIFPFVSKSKIIKDKFYYIYFYYVGVVFLITYIARIRGNFEGASPSWLHYLGFIAIAIALVLMPIIKQRQIGKV